MSSSVVQERVPKKTQREQRPPYHLGPRAFLKHRPGTTWLGSDSVVKVMFSRDTLIESTHGCFQDHTMNLRKR